MESESLQSSRIKSEAIRKLLEQLDRNTLINVLVDLAIDDDETANYLEVCFGARGEDEDIAALTAKIEKELDLFHFSNAILSMSNTLSSRHMPPFFPR